MLLAACGGREIGDDDAGQRLGASSGASATDSSPASGAAAGASSAGRTSGGGQTSSDGRANGGGSSGGSAAGHAGAGSAGGISALPNAACTDAMLDAPWPIIAGCLSQPTGTMLRCAFPRQLNEPSYGSFIGCCPLSLPFGCANGTPHSCFPNAEQAAASCGNDNCQQCAPY